MNEEQEVIVNNESGNNPFLKDGYGIWSRLIILGEEHEFPSDQEVYDGDIHKATSISFDPETLTEVEVGSVIQVELVPEPNIANVPVCVWETSDETVARVNGQGKIFFYKSGEVTITAIDVTDPGVNTSFEFTVVEPGVKPEPEPEVKIVMTFNIENVGEYSTPILYNTDYISAIEIDGIRLPELVTEYKFEQPGEHVVSVTLLDKTTFGTSFQGIYFNSIVLPDTITAIDKHAFYGCTSVSEMTIQNGVVTIGDNAFEDCSELKYLTIPESVLEIGYHNPEWFSLYEITFLSTTPPPRIHGYFLDCCSKIYVPSESLEAYKEEWYNKEEIIEPITNN